MSSLMYPGFVVIFAIIHGWSGSLPVHASLPNQADPEKVEEASRQNARILLGMSPEAIAAVDLDGDRLWQGLADLNADKFVLGAYKNNAQQLQRAISERQALIDAGNQAPEVLELSLEIRSRQESTRIIIQECREIVFGEFAKGESFRIVAGEVSPWDTLPLPYRNPSVPAAAALEVLKMQTYPSINDAAIRLRLDQLFVQFDLAEDVVLMRSRISERLPRVLEALGRL